VSNPDIHTRQVGKAPRCGLCKWWVRDRDGRGRCQKERTSSTQVLIEGGGTGVTVDDDICFDPCEFYPRDVDRPGDPGNWMAYPKFERDGNMNKQYGGHERRGLVPSDTRHNDLWAFACGLLMGAFFLYAVLRCLAR